METHLAFWIKQLAQRPKGALFAQDAEFAEKSPAEVTSGRAIGRASVPWLHQREERLPQSMQVWLSDPRRHPLPALLLPHSTCSGFCQPVPSSGVRTYFPLGLGEVEPSSQPPLPTR